MTIDRIAIDNQGHTSRHRTDAGPEATHWTARIPPTGYMAISAVILAIATTLYSFVNGYILAYGDAESHLNIAKRVIDSLTPGVAQLGGIWLPVPHLLLVPFVYFDSLWRTGLAGSIVSGAAFVASAIYIYKIVFLLTRSVPASFIAGGFFISNPNILYLQSTPMTELVLIAFFIVSSYHFIAYIADRSKLVHLVSAAFFGFLASLSRYDGWALVLMQLAVLCIVHFLSRKSTEKIKKLEGRALIFSTLAFFGIALWIGWGFLILGDPLYFTHSDFSAKSQQNSWYARGELPSYHDLPSAITYYSVTTHANAGAILVALGVLGLLFSLFDTRIKHRYSIALILLVPYFFNIATLYLGQSVIFIPSLTPNTFEWKLFNVRYGAMMIPCLAIYAGYLLYRLMRIGNGAYTAGVAVLGICLIGAQSFIYVSGRNPVISLEDGRIGLSSVIARERDAERWFYENYDYGLVLADDFSRAISIVRSPVRMEDVIYVGTKPYWEESLREPEKYARWIIMQEHDPIWKNVWENLETQSRLFGHFNKVYTSDEVLIFKKTDDVPAP